MKRRQKKGGGERHAITTEAVRDISRMGVQEGSADWQIVRDREGQVGGLIM